ncbi:Heavy-metal-associated domain-containing protein [Clostridium collagenovorans DSM 3089]|uniref:Heavy-metal-associated domain-containing protein n=1 Tax=Clostridium collagenovorans DSM 3089 TaxID=1121306 RepID=A0A1M5W1I5_9CLOT|nr:cation transporter [Clostridium collagenovorans]SHH81074.1 Heavy-metal-associated domain-containing protein [Clostridium collagenovorans DSM 3089]
MKKIFIEGMSCGHCVKHVTEALEELDTVSKVEVSLENKTALVEGSSTDEELKAAIEEYGYDVIKIENI